MTEELFTDPQRAFLTTQRVARLASADAAGRPHVVPVCYACDDQLVFIALDEKPKRVAAPELKRVRNIRENPRVALVVDHYSDDWTQLAFVLIHGTATLLAVGVPEHAHAVALLRERYPQYRAMRIEEQSVIAIQPEKVIAWGALP